MHRFANFIFLILLVVMTTASQFNKCDKVIVAHVDKARAFRSDGKDISIRSDAKCVSMQLKEKIEIQSDKRFIVMGGETSFNVIIPLSEALTENKQYVLHVDYLTNYDDTLLNNISLMSSRKLKDDFELVSIYQFCSYDSSITTDAQWHPILITFVAGKSMKSLQFNFKNVNAKQVFCLRDFTVQLESSTDSLNLIPNGDFETTSIVPDGLYFGAEDSWFWQECTKSAPSCIETRDGIKRNHGRIDKRGYKDSVFTGFLPALGSPDINSSNLYRLNGGVVAYSGRYYGRLCASKVDTPRDNHTIPGEYFQVKLKDKLVAGATYEFSVAYMHDPTSGTITNNLGVKFTQCAFSMIDRLAYKHVFPECDILMSSDPISDTSWVFKTYSYKATGYENYITIGPFVKSGTPEKSHDVSMRSPAQVTSKGFYLIDALSLKLKTVQ